MSKKSINEDIRSQGVWAVDAMSWLPHSPLWTSSPLFILTLKMQKAQYSLSSPMDMGAHAMWICTKSYKKRLHQSPSGLHIFPLFLGLVTAGFLCLKCAWCVSSEICSLTQFLQLTIPCCVLQKKKKKLSEKTTY